MTGPARFRQVRRDLYQRLFSSRALFITGICIMPALLFNPNPLFRVLQFLFFWFLAWLAGRKNNPFITFLIILGIVAFNLLVPYGRVLFSLGVFKITAGALLAGIQRAFTLEALIMLSRFTIRQDLKLPGAFGELIGESFRIFALIMDRKGAINRKNIAGGIDALMLELSGTVNEQSGKEPAETARVKDGKTHVNLKIPGVIILGLITFIAWIPVIFHVFYSIR
jgi:heptaprenyl diphosphate synthase